MMRRDIREQAVKAIEGTGLTLSLTAAQKQSIKGDYSDPSYKILEKELIKPPES
jgi:hypothetical protein